MKKSIFKVFGLLVLMCVGFASCELLDGCKTCELVTLTNGVETLRSPGVLFCGEELENKESYSQTIGNSYTYYDCN
jgi:hypothetical protein